jgi:5,6-dimethylbenzimidazole synthase
MDTFDAKFRAGSLDLMRWRRDMCHPRTDPAAPAMLRTCLDTFSMAPQMGLSDPRRNKRIASAACASGGPGRSARRRNVKPGAWNRA